jgi:hypothetical protein
MLSKLPVLLFFSSTLIGNYSVIFLLKRLIESVECLSVAHTVPCSGPDCMFPVKASRITLILVWPTLATTGPTTTTIVLPRQATTQPQPFGFATYSNSYFQDQSTMNVNASSNYSIAPGASYQVFPNTWAAMNSSNDRVVVWVSVPDVSQLPINITQGFTVTEIQSTECSPPCSGSGVCSFDTGSCLCPPGFNGTLCETCASGFFGPTCQPCPLDCAACDQGISGTGLCLTPVVNASSACTEGQCTCPPGYALGENGTSCTQCAPGFFSASTGSCQGKRFSMSFFSLPLTIFTVCKLGCTQCAPTTGNCIACMEGFTLDPSDQTKCDALATPTSGGQLCGPGAYGVSTQSNCSACSPSCQTCNGPSSNDCLKCASNKAMFNHSCVTTNADGICEGSNGLIANNDKNECESEKLSFYQPDRAVNSLISLGCGAVTPNCASCKIPNYNVASTIKDAQCTGCLPGHFLVNGTCSRTCPAGSFLLQNNNSTSCTSIPFVIFAFDVDLTYDWLYRMFIALQHLCGHPRLLSHLYNRFRPFREMRIYLPIWNRYLQKCLC